MSTKADRGFGALIVQGPVRLGDQPGLRRAVRLMVRRAQDAGEIIADRDPPDDDAFVAWTGHLQEPVAFAVFFPVSRNRAWLDLLYTIPEARRTGQARKLMAEVESTCRRRGIRRILFGTRIGNKPMMLLAADSGFRRDSIQFARDLR